MCGGWWRFFYTSAFNFIILLFACDCNQNPFLIFVPWYQPAHEKIGVVDAQWIVHQSVPSLGNQVKPSLYPVLLIICGINWSPFSFFHRGKLTMGGHLGKGYVMTAVCSEFSLYLSCLRLCHWTSFPKILDLFFWFANFLKLILVFLYQLPSLYNWSYPAFIQDLFGLHVYTSMKVGRKNKKRSVKKL